MKDGVFGSWNIRLIVDQLKYVVVIPTFILWSLYDILTKTVVTKWQRTIISVGIIYNFVYLFIDGNIVNDNITGFIVCYFLTYLYGLFKKVLRIGELGKGDVVLFAIIGLLFGIGVGVLSIVLSFILFDLLFKLLRKIFPRLTHISAAFFPFITCALFLILFFIGENNMRLFYFNIMDMLHIKYKYINIF